MSEPSSTAAMIALFGVLLTICVLATRGLDRVGLPSPLLFLVVGMLGGSEGLGGLEFDKSDLAFRAGTVALVLILLDGGLNTRWSAVRSAAAPAGMLATVGVAATALIVAVGARLFGLPWGDALLVGAIVSSTDAAAVFGVLRGSGIRLDDKLQSTIEVESCANDPMAVILTLSAADALAVGSFDLGLFVEIPLQLVIGTGVGLGCGYLFRFLINTVRLTATGMYPVLIVAAALAAFGASTLVYGSGFLAVFLTAVVLGNGHLPFADGLRRVHDSIAWLSQVLMFLMLGLLVFPSRLLPEAAVGIGIGLVLGLVARPVATFVCLGWFRWPAREIALVSWTGLRGAVPIVLATFPVMKGLPGADRIFHIVFFVVVVSAIVPGATIRFAALRSRLGRRVGARSGTLELQLAERAGRSIHEFTVDPASKACGTALRELRLPESVAVVLILRVGEPLAARGSTVIEAGDVLFVVSDESDLTSIEEWLFDSSPTRPS